MAEIGNEVRRSQYHFRQGVRLGVLGVGLSVFALSGYLAVRLETVAYLITGILFLLSTLIGLILSAGVDPVRWTGRVFRSGS